MTYDKAYFDYLRNRSKLSFIVRRIFVSDLVRHFFGQVLDVGCGLGEFLERYPEGLGVDINYFVARDCVERDLHVFLADARYLPFSNGSFDGVLASNLLEHFADIEEVFAELARIIKPGGILVATVPAIAGFKHDSTHVSFIDRDLFNHLADRYSFQLKRIYNYPFPWSWLGKYLYFCELRIVLKKMIRL